MPGKIIKDISASMLQVSLNQLTGLVIFYVTSCYLTKNIFGELNWTLALLSIIIVFSGLGLEQIILKKVAVLKNGFRVAELFLGYTLLSSAALLFLISVFYFSYHGFFEHHPFIWGIGLSILISYNSNAVRQLLNGMEKFRALAFLLLSSNVTKAVLLCILASISKLSISSIALVYIAGSIVELFISFFTLYKLKLHFRPKWNAKEFAPLAKESIPQLGVLLFDSALARMDWILLGVLISQKSTAEYAFAYKIFEISRFPMLVIAPLLLPKLARIFTNDLRKDTVHDLQILFRFEVAISFIIPIVFNIIWVPFFHLISGGKYGSNNEFIYLILSISVPLHYVNNFLWTMTFVQHQLILSFRITVITSVLNILVNLLLIPYMGTIGAAISFSCCTILQVYLYKRFAPQEKLGISLNPLYKCFLICACIIVLFKVFSMNFLLGCIIAVSLYIITLFFSKVLQLNYYKKILPILKR